MKRLRFYDTNYQPVMFDTRDSAQEGFEDCYHPPSIFFPDITTLLLTFVCLCFIRLFFCLLFVCLFVCLFVRSFVRSFVCFLKHDDGPEMTSMDKLPKVRLAFKKPICRSQQIR